MNVLFTAVKTALAEIPEIKSVPPDQGTNEIPESEKENTYRLSSLYHKNKSE